jgi:hypothetical protein
MFLFFLGRLADGPGPDPDPVFPTGTVWGARVVVAGWGFTRLEAR